ncbi:LysE family translocator [Acinetobacter sp. V102_4]|uniref:LysE family translocator n=1 Tax=Acinetobacter sp. V102_4 TaxID=3072984 RepID=UPI00287C118C|nr:LysE family translocator [Acinetobacter sp. V102_4]MDS7931860.1 LysE family translocator [Acinetobacter sp. V102_4]
MDISSIWLFIIPFAIAAAIPGPAQGTLIGHVLSHGGRSSFPFIIGMVLGNTVWLVVATLGLAALALKFQTIFLIVKWLGIVYLLFIAWKMWSLDKLQTQMKTEQSVSRGILTGSFLTLSNPKAVIFFGAILPQAFDLTDLSWSQVAFITALGVSIDFSIQMIYLITASKVKKAIKSEKAMKRVNRTSAGLMVACAGWLGLSR